MVRKSDSQNFATKGPLVEVQKLLSDYGHGLKKKYKAFLIPMEFFYGNHIDTNQPIPVAAYYSPVCHKFLLISFGQWPPFDETYNPLARFETEKTTKGPLQEVVRAAKVKETEEKLRTQRMRPEIHIGELEKLLGEDWKSTTTKNYLRELIFARIEQGCELISVVAENTSQSEAVYRWVTESLEGSRGLAESHKIRERREMLIIMVDDPKHIRGVNSRIIRAANEFNLRAITEQMFLEVLSFLRTSCELLEMFKIKLNEATTPTSKNKTSTREQEIKETFERLRGLHSCVDFLWAYNCRQLIRGGRYGLFCGIGQYTSITPVALGSFYKLLEHAVDQASRILELVAEEQRQKTDRNALPFIAEVRRRFSETVTELVSLQVPLLNAIDNNPTPEDRKAIASALRKYHGAIRPAIGGGESYLENSETPIVDGIENKLKNVCSDSVLLLAQVIYPLQKLCKFPANVAMLARILELSG